MRLYLVGLRNSEEDCVLKESWLGDQSRMWELSLGRLEDRSEEPQVPRSLDLTLRIVMLPGKAMC